MDSIISTTPCDRKTKPLFRWVGGKQKLLSKIAPYIPNEYGTYFEPFFGGGALYFSLNPAKAVIGDKNTDVVNFLQVVRNEPSALIQSLKQNVNSSSAYYEIRASVPSGRIQKAARFQYLVNLGFSGVYRVNKKGEFNVPYSKETERCFFNEKQIRRASAILQNTKILCGDFEETVKSAKTGDFIYFDPPYTVAHDNNGFLEYNESIFEWKDQVKLAALVKKLSDRGVKILVSNANHASVRALYDSDHIFYIDRRSTVAADSEYRGAVKEILVAYN